MQSSRQLTDVAERVRETVGITVSTTAHAAGSRLRGHYHERDYFCFVLGGRFDEDAGGEHRCGTDTLIFHPRGDRHADRFDRDTRCLNIELPAAWGLEALGAAFARRDQRRDPALVGLARRIARELRADDRASELALHGLALELAAAWCRSAPPRREPAWLGEAIRLLDGDPRLEFRAIAAQVGVHPVQLSRAFRRARGVTMTEHTARLRVDRAAALLRTTQLPLAAIAIDTGFADQSHLARVFKRHTQMTCAAYRAAARVRER
jgi:AraC family transcriptional regulator